MKMTCSKWCRIEEWLANLKCPGCFTLAACEGSGDRITECECRLRMDTSLGGRWE
jgi:hypothetical protein